MTTIGVRELKARTSKVLRDVSEGRREFVITNHGRPCGKIVPIEEDVSGEKKSLKTLRGAYSHLPELNETDFHELKQAWKLNR